MGDLSELLFVPASIANIPIDWTRIPEDSIKYLGRAWEFESLPTTVAALAQIFDESKFFGYLDSHQGKLLFDISEFGLQPSPDQSMRAGPRFYMAYLDQVAFLIFNAPGKREFILGFSDSITIDLGPMVFDENGLWDDTGMYQKRVAEEAVIAEQFDARLEQDVSGGMVLLDATKKLGGWDAHIIRPTPGFYY